MSTTCEDASAATTAYMSATTSPVVTSTHAVSTKISLEFHADPAEIADQWQAFEAHAICSLYQSYKWMSAWCRNAARQHGERPFIVIGYDPKGRIALIWPMAISSRMGLQTLTWLGQSYTSYNMGLYRRDIMETLDTQELQRLLTLITRERPELCAGHFTSQPAEWDGLENPFIRLRSQRSAVQAYELKLDPSFDKLYTSILSSRSRSVLRRKERKLRGSGKLSIGLAETPDRCIEIFEGFLQQKALQFKEQGIRNLFADPYVQDFYRDLFAGKDSGDAFECDYIHMDEELVATFTGIRFKDRYYYLTSSMTLGELRQWSPGLILIKEVIDRSCRRGAKYFDLGPGQGMHKDMWKGSEIPFIETHLSFRAKSCPVTVTRRAGTHVKKAIKNHPALLRVVRKTRQLAHRLLSA